MYKSRIKLETLIDSLYILKFKCDRIFNVKQKRKFHANLFQDHFKFRDNVLFKVINSPIKNKDLISKKPKTSGFLKKLAWLPMVFALDVPEDQQKTKEELHKVMDEVIELIGLRKLGEAEVLLLRSRRLAEKLDAKENLREVEFLMATLALEQKRYRIAEQKLERIVEQMLREGALDNDIRLLQVSLQLARVYEAKELLGKAEKVYLCCTNHLMHQAGKSHVVDILLVDSLWDYADFVMRRRRYADEQDLREMAYEAAVKTFGEIHEYTRDILGNLGRVCLIRGDIQKGKQYLEKAAKTAKALVRKDTSAFIVAIGRLFLAGRMYGEARTYCSEGLMKIDTDDGEGRRLRNAALRCLEEVKKAISPKS